MWHIGWVVVFDKWATTPCTLHLWLKMHLLPQSVWLRIPGLISNHHWGEGWSSRHLEGLCARDCLLAIPIYQIQNCARNMKLGLLVSLYLAPKNKFIACRVTHVEIVIFRCRETGVITSKWHVIASMRSRESARKGSPLPEWTYDTEKLMLGFQRNKKGGGIIEEKNRTQ